MTDLKVLDTRGLLQLIFDERCFSIPDDILVQLDVNGRHMFQAHSLYNLNPEDPVVHARSLFKTYDETDVDRYPMTLVHIPRARWEDLPDWYG